MSKKKQSNVTLILVMVIVFLLGYVTRSFLNTDTFTFNQNKMINKVAQLIRDNYIEEVDQDYIADFAMKGMAAALQDPYAYYYTPEEILAYNESVSGVVHGNIGVSLASDGGKIVVSEVYKGMPADALGMRAGDVILDVDGKSTAGLSASQVSALLSGETGTILSVTVERNGKTLKFNPTRSDGQRDLAEYRMLENGILYIKIFSFNGNAYAKVKEAVEFGEANGYKSVLIDVRNNGGGSIDIFASMADLFLPEGETFYALDRKGNKIESCKSDARHIDKPCAVLVNGSSASASEAFAGAMRDMGNAKLVGTKTYGKGVMQVTYGLPNGGAFKITVAKYYLPGGECIHELGVTPEYVVELDESLDSRHWLLNDSNDLQLKKAIELLTNN